jgi:hypothetical protein
MQVIGCLLGLVVCSISSIHVKPIINGDINDLAQDRPGSYLIATNSEHTRHTLQNINGKDYVRVEYKQIPCKKKTDADNHSSNNQIRIIKTGFETTCRF